MQMLPCGQPEFADLSDNKRIYGSLLILVWSCLPVTMRDRIKPRDLSKDIDATAESIEPVISAFWAAFIESNPGIAKDDDEDESGNDKADSQHGSGSGSASPKKSSANKRPSKRNT